MDVLWRYRSGESQAKYSRWLYSVQKCGERFVPLSPQQKVCTNCSGYHPLGKKKLRCIDCGKEFEVDGIVKNKKRCNDCQAIHIRNYEREKKRRQRSVA